MELSFSLIRAYFTDAFEISVDLLDPVTVHFFAVLMRAFYVDIDYRAAFHAEKMVMRVRVIIISGLSFRDGQFLNDFDVSHRIEGIVHGCPRQ